MIRSYHKKEPFRDSTLFVIVCEGEKREPDYFNTFDRRSSRIRVITNKPENGNSALVNVLGRLERVEEEIGIEAGDHKWIVFDRDRIQGSHIAVLDDVVRKNWRLALSNPCFEVWLLCHFDKCKAAVSTMACNEIKQYLDKKCNGGFDAMKHSTLIPEAVKNAKNEYSGQGYFPDHGCTGVYELAELILELIEDEL